MLKNFEILRAAELRRTHPREDLLRNAVEKIRPIPLSAIPDRHDPPVNEMLKKLMMGIVEQKPSEQYPAAVKRKRQYSAEIEGVTVVSGTKLERKWIPYEMDADETTSTSIENDLDATRRWRRVKPCSGTVATPAPLPNRPRINLQAAMELMKRTVEGNQCTVNMEQFKKDK